MAKLAVDVSDAPAKEENWVTDGGEDCRKDAIAYAKSTIADAAGHAKAQAQLDKATEMYRSVLQHEPNNVYAANGLGTVCVEKGRLQEAREIFTVVREAAAGCEAACDYIWRRAPGFIDRNRPETWLDPHERWTPSGGRTGSSFNVSTARICRHAGV